MLTVLVICVTGSFVAGVIDSIAGGGGLITLPAMLLAGLPPHAALGTGKFAATIGTSAALFNYARGGFVAWHMAPLGVACALAGAWGGSELALVLDATLLNKILVCMLPVGMLVTLMPRGERKNGSAAIGGALFWVLLPVVSAAIGIYDGFFGPGTGCFFIMAFYWILKLDLVKASGTAKLFNLASNIGSFFAFCINGQILYAVAVPMACASIAGNWIGSRVAIRAGSGAVRKFLVISLCLLMVTLSLKLFRN